MSKHEPWLTEPLYTDWVTEAGIHCLMRRTSLEDHWCGYVRIPHFHPWEKEALDTQEADALLPVGFNIHGGVTYSRWEHPTNREDTSFLWLGFDCAHFSDYSPRLAKALGVIEYDICYPTQYRDYNYVLNEVDKFASMVSLCSGR